MLGTVCFVRVELPRTVTALRYPAAHELPTDVRLRGQSGHAVLHCKCLLMTQSGLRLRSRQCRGKRIAGRNSKRVVIANDAHRVWL